MRYSEFITESINAQNFPSLLGTMNGGKTPGWITAEKFNTVIIPIIVDSLKKKEIYNVDFKEVKDFLNRAIEYTAKNFVSELYLSKHRGNSDSPEGATEAYYATWGLHTVPGIHKKLSKYPDDEVAKAGVDLATELAPLSAAMKALKPFIVKGRKPNPNAKKVDVYVPPLAARADIKQVHDKLTELTNGIRQELFDETMDRIKAYAEQFRDKKRKDPKFRVYDLRNPEAIHYLQSLMDTRTGEPLPDYETKKPAMAQKSADEQVAGFIAKNTKKLSSIVGKKGNLKDVVIMSSSARGGTIEGRLKITFDD